MAYYYKNGNNYLVAKHELTALELEETSWVEITEEEYNNRNSKSSEPDSNRAEILNLKAELKSTDEKALEFIDGFIDEKEYAPIRARRIEIRNQLKKLEGDVKA